jgi:hypothetical protein
MALTYILNHQNSRGIIMGKGTIPDGYSGEDVNAMKDGVYDDCYGFCDVETRPYHKQVAQQDNNDTGCAIVAGALGAILLVMLCGFLGWGGGYYQGSFVPEPTIPMFITATPTTIPEHPVYPAIRNHPQGGSLFQTVQITGVQAEHIKFIGYSWERNNVKHTPTFCSGVIECMWERPLVADTFFIVVSVGDVVHYLPADSQAQYIKFTISN